MLLLSVGDASIDFHHYKNSFHGDSERYEVGFNFLLNLFYGVFEFEFFWGGLLFFEALLMAYIFKDSNAAFWMIVPYLYVFDFVYANQVRWGVATLLVFCFCKSRLVSLLLPVLFHKASLVLFSIYQFSLLPKVVVFLLLFLSWLIVGQLFESVAVLAGYEYYLDSAYSQSRSLASAVYSLFFSIVGWMVWSSLSGISKFVIVAHMFSLSFFSFAVISGRIIDSVAILEAFVLYDLFKNRTSLMAQLLLLGLLCIELTRLVIKWM